MDFQLVKVLGNGAFAKVILARYKATGVLYAIKMIHKSKIMMNIEEESKEGLSQQELAFRNMYRVKQIISERNIFIQLSENISE